MSPKTAVGALLTVCFCVVSVAIVVTHFRRPHTEGAPQANSDAGTYAYITSDDLLLMRGDKIVTRVPRDYAAEDPYENHVVWTRSGHFVATLSTGLLHESDLPKQELVFIDVRDGVVKRIPCPRCSDLVAVGANDVLVTAWGIDPDAGRSYFRYTLDSTTPAKATPVVLGDGNEGILVGTERSVLTVDPGSVNGTYQQHVVLHDLVKSTVVDYGYFDSNDYVRATVDPGSSATIALAVNPNAGTCERTSPIKLLAANGGIVSTDMREAEPPGYLEGVPGGVSVNDLLWAADGHLHASMTSWTCDTRQRAENDKQILDSANSIFRLDGERWVKENSDRATVFRQVDDGSWLTLLIPDCIGPVTHSSPTTYCNTGTLYRDHMGQRAKVADGVISISVPQPGHATNPPPSPSIAATDPLDLVAPMVGIWYVHGARMVIQSDHTGTSLWNAGPCHDPSQSPDSLMCSGHADLTFTIASGLVVGRYEAVLYRDRNDKVVHEYDAGDDGIKVGDTFKLVRVENGVLKETTNIQGNPYWCSADASAAWHKECNA
ncbi:hypothetical protein [Actinoplanes sp. NPDC026623]|uniref:hypothetical protein n=1 Tax=Actinoplanes sp. NPDC026623 TaxID=3155610 RepID=UPI0033CC3370